MPQQINLCTPILLTQRRYFSARTMAQALAFFVVVGGSLAAYWVWSLKMSSDGFRQTLGAHTGELETLRAAIQAAKAGGGPPDTGLSQALQAQRVDLANREKVLVELRRGLFREGWGQSTRLQLIAQSIPAQVWVTDVKADDRQLDVSGFTLEPVALNEWVRKLSASSLLQGQKLAAIKVQRVGRDGAVVTPEIAGSPALAPSAGGTATPNTQRPMWSFTLVSTIGPSTDASAKGKP